jgi:hypothetical protein
MSEALHSFVLSVSCIVGVALLIPGVEAIARRLRRNGSTPEQPEVIRLTPAQTQVSRRR